MSLICLPGGFNSGPQYFALWALNSCVNPLHKIKFQKEVMCLLISITL